MPGLIFISHATPDDNDFVLWLAGRLAGAGYEVWSDLTKLIGGEIFWDRIETAIRRDAVLFISVISRRSITKRNFLNELSVANSVEVSRGTDDFVLPIRIDDFPFGDVPAQLHRKNIVDFGSAWHLGLEKVLKKLTELRVPNNQDTSKIQLNQWSKAYFGFSRGVELKREELATNWLQLQDCPSSLFVFKFPVGVEVPKLFEPHVWPLVKYRDQIISFARPKELGVNGDFGDATEVSIDAIVSNEARFLVGATTTAGQAIVTHLVRRAWERYARSNGLVGYRLSGRKIAWFLPVTGADIAWIEYRGMSGEKRRKRLIGKSETRGVYWHAALEFVPLIQSGIRVGLSMHVVFTKDGVTPLGEPATMHRLRRRFCKNWWQGQWRDLQFSYLAFLSRGQSSIHLSVAPNRVMQYATDPIRISSPVSYVESKNIVSDEVIAVDELSIDDHEPDDLDEFDQVGSELAKTS